MVSCHSSLTMEDKMFKKDMRKSVALSVLAFVLSLALLIGSTYAWFTDSVTNTNNQIKTGLLKIDLLHLVGDDWVSLKENPDHPILDYDKWEPGYTALAVLKVDPMNSSLAFTYRMTLALDMTDAEQLKLADVIEVWLFDGISDATAYADMTEVNGWHNVGTLAEVVAQTNGLHQGVVLPGQTNDDTLTLALHMQEESGNNYQKLSLGGLYITFEASQSAYETDDFGNSDFDKDALLPIHGFDTIHADKANNENYNADAGEYQLQVSHSMTNALVQQMASATDSFGYYSNLLGYADEWDATPKSDPWISVGPWDYLNGFVAEENVVINGKGNTITFAADNYGNKAFNALATADGYTATMKDINFRGQMVGFTVGTYGQNGAHTDKTLVQAILSDVNMLNVEADYTFLPAVAPLTLFANTQLDACNVIGSTDANPHASATGIYDVAVYDYATVTVKGGQYGSMYLYEDATLVAADTEIGTLVACSNVCLDANAVVDTLHLYNKTATAADFASVEIAARAEARQIVVDFADGSATMTFDTLIDYQAWVATLA